MNSISYYIALFIVLSCLIIDLPAQGIDLVLFGKAFDLENNAALRAEISVAEPISKTPLGSTKSDTKAGNYALKVKSTGTSVFLKCYSENKYFTSSIMDLSLAGNPDSLNVDFFLGTPIEFMEEESVGFQSLSGTFELKNILFDLDKDVLKPISFISLNQLVEYMRKNPFLNLKIQGHTDAQADDNYNLDLSRRRSVSVAEYLVGKGIRASRLSWKGYGETVPIATNETEEGRARNRRVEFKLHKND